jgi:hypothetical protein
MHQVTHTTVARIWYPKNERMSGNLPYLIMGGVLLFALIAILAVVVTHFRRKARLERIEKFHRRKDREGER